MADNYTVINSCSQIITMKSKDVGAGVEAVQSIPTDTAGTPMLVLSGSAVTSSMSAMVAAISSLSALFSVSIASSANAANVVGASSVPTSSMGAVVTSLRPDSPGIITTGTAGSPSSVFLSVQGSSGMTPITVGGVTTIQSSAFTRPANTTAYAQGQLVANSTVAGSVTNLQFATLARVTLGSGVVIGAQIQKTTNVTTNAQFRVHIFNSPPTYTSAGDGSAMTTVVVASSKGYNGYVDITTMVGFSDVAWGSGAPDNARGGIPYVSTSQIIYGLLEARSSYTPGSAEVFNVYLDALQD